MILNIAETAGPNDDAADAGQAYCFAAFFFAAWRAFKAATIRARPSGLSLRFFFLEVAAGAAAVVEEDDPLTLAQRACCEARIFAIVAADMVRLPPRLLAARAVAGADEATEALLPKRPASSD